jgi:uncharacterized spore protein YtfJ
MGMASHEDVKNEVAQLQKSYADEFLTTLAARIGASAKATMVFADPVERNGITIIPVAKARWGFGGGAGRTKKEDGGGGGGGAIVTPIGFISIREGEVRFQRIWAPSFSLIALSGVVGFFLLRNLLRR